MVKKIAVIGSSGFVGNAICEVIDKKSNYQCIRVTRNDDLKFSIKNADIIIHAANPSKRFWAEQNPEIDFQESVAKTSFIKENTAGKKIILISSISARTQLHTVYGRNRRACELIIGNEKNLIIRLGPLYGSKKFQGALFDILSNRTVFLSGDSEYAYAPIEYCGKKIISSLSSSGMMELGAFNSIKLSELARILGSTSHFQGDHDSQIPKDFQSDAPDAYDVIDFSRNLLAKGLM